MSSITSHSMGLEVIYPAHRWQGVDTRFGFASRAKGSGSFWRSSGTTLGWKSLLELVGSQEHSDADHFGVTTGLHIPSDKYSASRPTHRCLIEAINRC